MPSAFISSDGTIRDVVRKLAPYMRVEPGERIVGYNPPATDPEIEDVAPVLPVAESSMEVEFAVTPRNADAVKAVWTRRKSAVVQNHLDTTAQEAGYDNILAAISYVNSPTYGAEATNFRNWRDACWVAFYPILNAALAGTTPMPSDSALIAALPTFQNS